MKTENKERHQEIKKDYFGVDTIEDILKCLNCKKEECNNCLKHKNFI